MQQYKKLLADVILGGVDKPAARENMPGTRSLFGYQFRHDLSDGFPLLTTKKIFWKGVVVELLWFLRGDTNIKFLLDNGCNIWNEDAYNFYLKTVQPYHFSYEDFIEAVKTRDVYQNEEYQLGDCGFQYGKTWRRWQGEPVVGYYNQYREIDQITKLIDGIRSNPEGRRHIVTSIDPAHDKDLALYWCHALFQFNCRPLSIADRIRYYLDHFYSIHTFEERFLEDNNVPQYYLDCQLYQRSADVILGVPFNIASYALLTTIIAKMCNMIPGDFIHTFGDVHLYGNHLDAATEQLTREVRPLPELILPKNVQYNGTIVDFLQSVLVEDLVKGLTGYDPHPAIKAELSTGLIK